MYCIQHRNHCRVCNCGISNYEEYDENTYAKSFIEDQLRESNYDRCSTEKVLTKDDDHYTTEKVLNKDDDYYTTEKFSNKDNICSKCFSKNPIYSSTLGLDLLKPINSQLCVQAPEPSEEFKLIENDLKKCICQCENHDYHCAVCGKGILNESEGVEVNMIYTYNEIQNVTYPEVDHHKCNDCYKESKKMLPTHSYDWNRKQEYFDFLLLRRKDANRNSCFHKRQKM